MNVEDFIDKLIAAVQGHLRKGCSFHQVISTKNNNQKYYGIQLTQEGNRVSPVYYVNSIYEDYMEGKITFAECAEVFFSSIDAPINASIDIDFLGSYDNVKDKIKAMLVNYEANKEQLMERPHLRFLDLAVVFYAGFTVDETTSGIIHINNSTLKLWNVDKDEFVKNSLQHYLKTENATVMDMQDVLMWMMKDEFFEEALPELMRELFAEGQDLRGHLYVITNTERRYGASMLFHHAMLHDFATKNNDNLIIYPSSVHELIITFESAPFSRWLTSADVESINGSNVLPEERLSNSVYRYDRHTQEISILYKGAEVNG